MSQVPALFADLDETLTYGSLGVAFYEAMCRMGLIGEREQTSIAAARHAWQRHAGSAHDYHDRVVNTTTEALHSLVLDRDGFHALAAEVGSVHHEIRFAFSWALLQAARIEGYLTFVISHSPGPAVEQVGRHLGVHHAIGHHVEFHSETGVFVRRTDVEKGSVIERLVKEHDIDLSRSVAIGDSASDLPMLTRVGWPIAFNPKAAFSAEIDRLAQAENYRIPSVIEFGDAIRAFRPRAKMPETSVGEEIALIEIIPRDLLGPLARFLPAHLSSRPYGWYYKLLG